MNKKELNKHIGERVNIINGKCRLAEDGDFIISKSFTSECIWVPDEGKVQCITKQPFIGRNYRISKVDCITLVCEYLESESLLKWYHGLSLENVLKMQTDTVANWLDNDTRFTNVGMDYDDGDVLLYAHAKNMVGNHIGIAYPGDKILHHLPNKLSCIDDMDLTKIERGYKFNG